MPMKHKRALFGGLFASALIMGTLTPTMLKKSLREEIGPDNADYGERLSVDYNSPDVLPIKKATSNVKPTSISIHYHNDDGKNNKRELWIWCAVADGKAYAPTTVSADGKDMEVAFDFTGDKAPFATCSSIFFIVKFKEGTEEGGGDGWQGKSENTEVVYEDQFAPDENGKVTIWCIPGEGTLIETYPTEADTKTDRFLSANFKDWKSITVNATAAPINYKLYALTSNYMAHSLSADLNDYLIAEGGQQNSSTFTINLNYTAKVNVQYLLEGYFPNYPNYKKQKYVGLQTLYETDRFETYYQYTGDDLGCTYNGANSTTFKVWAPAAANVRVFLYDSGSIERYKSEDPSATNSTSGGYNMAFRPGGVWELTITGKDLKGKYYKYQVANALGKQETMDPYAKACGVNGDRAMIVDWNETNPDGWDNVPAVWDGVSGYDIENPNQLSIYETHIRDLTMDSTWVSNNNNLRGTYSAFAEAGTTYSQGGVTVTTGYSHIEEFGVKAIQLIPVFDNDNLESLLIDEKTGEYKERSYNWGYNPLNYNCVDGSYATDPYNGASRIKEFKTLIANYANNKNHTRIIMDVVYNHVSSLAGHCFTKLMPYYFFRYAEDYSPYNGSGCGNEVKTEAPMCSKYIVDSLCWWAKEYKIKGFRFDLMGLIDYQTIKKAAQELYKIDKDIYLYGEGWTSGGCHMDNENPGDKYYGNWGADTWTVYNKLYKDGDMCYVGGFNNEARNKIAGETGNASDWGFILQGTEPGGVGDKSNVIADMLVGNHTGVGGNPNQMIAYSSCHDDFSTFDHLAYLLTEVLTGEQRRTIGDAAAATSAVESAMMMSNGVAFIQGGQECFLSKKVSAADLKKYGKDRTVKIGSDYVSSNSYRLSDYTNAIKWDRKIAIGTTNVYGCYQGLMKACNERNKMNKYDLAYLSSHDAYSTSSSFHVELQGDNSCKVKLVNGNYTYIIAGNTGDNCVNGFVSYSSLSSATQIFSTNGAGKGYNDATGGFKMWWYTAVCLKA